MKKIIVFFVLFFLTSALYCEDKDKNINETLKDENSFISVDLTNSNLSPNGDGEFDELSFKVSPLKEKLKIKNWTFSLVSIQTNEVFDSFSGKKELPPIIKWSGKDKTGKIREGKYKIAFNAFINKKDINIEKEGIVDITPPFLSVSTPEDIVFIDKEQNKFSKDIAFILNSGDENGLNNLKTKLQVINSKDIVVKEWIFNDKDSISKTIYWDGIDDIYGLVIPTGQYKVVFAAYDNFGNRSSMTLSFMVVEKVLGNISEIVVKEEPRGLVVNLSNNILFSAHEIELKKEAKDSLDEMIKLLNAYPANKVLIEGYSDSSGNKEENLKLSYDRAQEVYLYFVKNGISAERLTVVGYGQENPIASNKTAKGRAQNRRVKIIILKSQNEDININEKSNLNKTENNEKLELIDNNK